MQPKTEGLVEQGPSAVPYINDPENSTSPRLKDADATDAAEADEDTQSQSRR